MSAYDVIATEFCTAHQGPAVEVDANDVCRLCRTLAHNLRVSITTTRDRKTGRYVSRKAAR